MANLNTLIYELLIVTECVITAFFHSLTSDNPGEIEKCAHYK